MTEGEWLTANVSSLLNDLDGLAYPHYAAELPPALRARATGRALRLFACACCRCLWARLPTDRCRAAVEAAERYADDPAAGDDLRQAQADAAAAYRDWSAAWVASLPPDCHPLDRARRSFQPDQAVVVAVRWATADDLGGELGYMYACLWAAHSREGDAAVLAALRRYADLLRDVFGNPFHPVAFDPAWRAWNHGTVPAIARRAYDERAFHDLPILADALEDAGCGDADLLAHCRCGGEHVRGCWAVDLLLGKHPAASPAGP